MDDEEESSVGHKGSSKEHNIDANERITDFAFIDKFYVPQYVLVRYGIKEDRQVRGVAISTSSKWKVVAIQPVND